jgi:hypothetical protein
MSGSEARGFLGNFGAHPIRNRCSINNSRRCHFQ